MIDVADCGEWLVALAAAFVEGLVGVAGKWRR
jgi:hypothetical protein